jgi:uncharacterized protein
MEKDIANAVELYARAADVGDMTAIYNLGACYECGNGVDKDASKAVERYTRAVDKGLAGAMCNLAFCYERGFALEKDATKAQSSCTRALPALVMRVPCFFLEFAMSAAMGWK